MAFPRWLQITIGVLVFNFLVLFVLNASSTNIWWMTVPMPKTGLWSNKTGQAIPVNVISKDSFIAGPSFKDGRIRPQDPTIRQDDSTTPPESGTIRSPGQRQTTSVDELLDRNSTSAYSDLDDFVLSMKARKATLANQCQAMKRNPTGPFTYNFGNLYVLQKKGLIWCPVFKAGSSNWIHNLLDLSGISETEKEIIQSKTPNQPNIWGRKVAPRMLQSSFHKYISSPQGKEAVSFIIVRHPFHRLVSAYRDKLERRHTDKLQTDFYYTKYGQKIVKSYRARAIKRFGKGFFNASNNYGSPVAVNGVRVEQLPTFWEFVQYVINTPAGQHDEHWRPMHNYCSVCMINYDFIIKFENLSDEERWFFKYLKVEDRLNAERWENPNLTGMKKSDLLSKYFSMLDDSDIRELYGVYANDFKLFNYDFQWHNMTFPPGIKKDTELYQILQPQ